MAPKTATNKRVTDLLRAVPLFSDCTKRELSAVAGAGKEVDHPAGDVICREGEPGIGLHVIVEGETRVEIGGKIKGRLGPGAFFGEIALLDKGPRMATVVAQTPVVTFVIPSWNFRDVLQSQPGLALKMLEEVSRRFRTSADVFTDCSPLPGS